LISGLLAKLPLTRARHTRQICCWSCYCCSCCRCSDWYSTHSSYCSIAWWTTKSIHKDSLSKINRPSPTDSGTSCYTSIPQLFYNILTKRLRGETQSKSYTQSFRRLTGSDHRPTSLQWVNYHVEDLSVYCDFAHLYHPVNWRWISSKTRLKERKRPLEIQCRSWAILK